MLTSLVNIAIVYCSVSCDEMCRLFQRTLLYDKKWYTRKVAPC